MLFDMKTELEHRRFFSADWTLLLWFTQTNNAEAGPAVPEDLNIIWMLQYQL